MSGLGLFNKSLGSELFLKFLFIAYLIVLLLPICGIVISNYSTIFLAFYTVALVMLMPKIKTVQFAIFVFVIFSFLFFFLYRTSVWYYLFIDFFTCVIIFQIFIVAKSFPVSLSTLKIIKNLSCLYLALVCLGTLNPSFYSTYEVNRYMGLNLGPNLTSSIVLMMLIYLREYYDVIMKRSSLFIFCLLVTYVIVALTAKSRGFILGGGFFVGYVLYHKGLLFRSILYFFLVLLLFGAGHFVFEKLRFVEDGSFNTRLLLYVTFFDSIKESFYILPNGFEADQLLLNSTNQFYNVELHNDILKYWYNYGLLFFMFLLFVGSRVAAVGTKGYVFVISFVFMLNSLQNTLFSVFLLIPFLGLLLAKEYGRNLSSAL